MSSTELHESLRPGHRSLVLRISDDPRVEGPERELRDGIVLVIIGALVAFWLLRTGAGPAAGLGFAIGAWGLVLTADALRLRSRRRT